MELHASGPASDELQGILAEQLQALRQFISCNERASAVAGDMKRENAELQAENQRLRLQLGNGDSLTPAEKGSFLSRAPPKRVTTPIMPPQVCLKRSPTNKEASLSRERPKGMGYNEEVNTTLTRFMGAGLEMAPPTPQSTASATPKSALSIMADRTAASQAGLPNADIGTFKLARNHTVTEDAKVEPEMTRQTSSETLAEELTRSRVARDRPSLSAKSDTKEPDTPVVSKPSGRRLSLQAPAVSRQDRLNFLSEVELFKHLSAADVSLIGAVSEDCHFSAGEALFKQGDVGHDFFLIVKGKVSVLKDGREVNILGNGAYFGEQALLHDQPRNATILAKDDIHALKISSKNFHTYGLADKIEKPEDALGKLATSTVFSLDTGNESDL